jgi:L-aspartate oxidase
MKQIQHDFPVLIIGSGLAGLTLALHLNDLGIKCAVLSKSGLEEGATYYSQGGIAAVTEKTDNFASHIKDTLIAGAGLCDEKVVKFVVENGPECIDWLIKQGVNFTKTNSHFHLNQEGGHSHRRIFHAEDATGRAVETTLLDVAKQAKNVSLFDYHMAIDLVLQNKKCVGAYVYDEKKKRTVIFRSKFIVLATGGASRVYVYTSNTAVASGDGIAMAWRAGCKISNMEFNQFHPTCLYHPKAGSFLISEAVRGEGAHLLLPDGTRFMQKFHKLAELAPRDIVARAIDHEMKRLGIRNVFLDISFKPADFIRAHFPNIYQECLRFGYDMTKEPIPVVPAAHYTCGGVKVDLHGKTSIPNLYAIGEVSCTGLHGANRLASNSLLECMVFAKTTCKHISKNIDKINYAKTIRPWDESWVTDSNEEVFVLHNWEEIRSFMWDYVGIVRSDKRLERASHRVHLLKNEIQEYYQDFRINKNLLELRNLIVVAKLIVASANKRQESRGLHYTLDYLKTLPQNQDTILKRRRRK